MNKAKKIMMLAACAVLLVCISVGATLAYLTDTEAVTNTFTVGQVDIDLYETGPDGKPVKENSYHLIPGQSYKKDPTIYVKPESEDAYVVAKIVVSGAEDSPLTYNEGALLGLAHTQPDGTVVNVVSGGVFSEKYEDKGNGVYENENYKLTQIKEGNDYVFMVYCKKPFVKDNGHHIYLFDSINVPSSWDNAEMATLDDLKIEVTAFAMQAAGFSSCEEAYATCSANGGFTAYNAG